MKVIDIINWRALSQELAQNPESIRKNSIPKKYLEDIDRLIQYMEYALEGKTMYSSDEVRKKLDNIDLFNAFEQK